MYIKHCLVFGQTHNTGWDFFIIIITTIIIIIIK